MSIAIGLLIARVVIGLIVAAHGAQKLFGWFGGHSFSGTVGFLQTQGFKPAWFWTLLGALGEFVGGLLLVLGFLSPLGALAIFAAMLMAVFKFHWKRGFWNTQGGYEYPLVLLILSVLLGLAGPGAYSLDALLGIALPNALLFWPGVIAAIVIDGIGIATSRQPASQQATA